MKKTNLKKRLSVFLFAVLLMVSLIPNCSFAYVEDATWGIDNPFGSSRIFYNENGSVKTLYTPYSQFNFSILGNPSNAVCSDLTQVYIKKEKSIGKGEYSNWQNANAVCWGAASGSSVGGVQTSCPYYRVNLAAEGRYKVLVYTYNQNGAHLFSQQFTVLYSQSKVCTNPKKIIDDVTVDTSAFTNSKGRSARVKFTVHDLTGNGLKKNEIYLRLCNLRWMQASSGHAGTYAPTDITITSSTVNRDEYIVSATISANYFKNVADEYYIECSLNGSYSGMFPALFIY